MQSCTPTLSFLASTVATCAACGVGPSRASCARHVTPKHELGTASNGTGRNLQFGHTPCWGRA
jgi:hypothetical protein